MSSSFSLTLFFNPQRPHIQRRDLQIRVISTVTFLNRAKLVLVKPQITYTTLFTLIQHQFKHASKQKTIG